MRCISLVKYISSFIAASRRGCSSVAAKVKPAKNRKDAVAKVVKRLLKRDN